MRCDVAISRRASGIPEMFGKSTIQVRIIDYAAALIVLLYQEIATSAFGLLAMT